MKNNTKPKTKKTNKTPQKSVVKKTKMISETIIAVLTHSTLTEAAKTLKIDRTTLYDRINNYELQPIIDSLPQQAVDQLKISSVKASEVLAEALNSYDQKLKVAVAQDILDRVTKKDSSPAVAVQVNNIIASKKDEYGI